MLRENPSMHGKQISNPVVTSALTHGLSIVGDMFVDAVNHVVLPDMLWGNYNLTYGTAMAVSSENTPPSPPMAATTSLRSVPNCRRPRREGQGGGSPQLPQQPSGYTPTVAEGDAIVATILEAAEAGCNIVAGNG